MAAEGREALPDLPVVAASGLVDPNFYLINASDVHAAEVDPALLRPSDEPIIFGDIAKIKRDTGWAPTIDIRQTIADVLAFEKDQYERHAA